jgi:hypothetical protein
MNTSFKKRWYFFIPLIIAGIITFSFITMALWNYLMPVIFNLPAINFWQALCLLILSRILFSGGPRPRHSHNPWAKNLREKWEKMTPEEREKFHQRLHSRCRPDNFGTDETLA